MSEVFLTAEWRKLVMANYVVDPAMLEPFLPAQTELDFFNGRCYVSLVGFMFLNTRLKGWRIPFHSNFEEVNLRFYAKHQHEGAAWRRGVVFIREIVPKPALTLTANWIYGEKYRTMRMRHVWSVKEGGLFIQYEWKSTQWNRLSVEADIRPTVMADGSEEEFIAEHYWGYTRLDERKTAEYEVRHPRWQVYPVHKFTVDVDFGNVYGRPFADLSARTPYSVFLAEGSQVAVHKGSSL